MRAELTRWTPHRGWEQPLSRELGDGVDLVLLFGARGVFRKADLMDNVRAAYPEAQVLGCSTAGEICGTSVSDDALVSAAVSFDSTDIRLTNVKIGNGLNSREVGQRLVGDLVSDDLAHVFVLSNGLQVNGSELVDGMRAELPHGVAVTGGLSGDGERFEETLVISGAGIASDEVAAIGMYSDWLKVSYGSLGGWDPFGPLRMITRATDNVLFELDGQPALDLYKDYLGEHADGLPATGLLFPLSLTLDDEPRPIVRTILGIDEKAGSMTFAGDVPEGSKARLMKANSDRLIDGAAGAAETCHAPLDHRSPDLAILISCVGRKLVLKQRIEEEVEAVRDVLGQDTQLAGFYSYGEISPFVQDARCELHNQTMTITAFSEA